MRELLHQIVHVVVLQRRYPPVHIGGKFRIQNSFPCVNNEMLHLPYFAYMADKLYEACCRGKEVLAGDKIGGLSDSATCLDLSNRIVQTLMMIMQCN
jgi:hypothetical protein